MTIIKRREFIRTAGAFGAGALALRPIGLAQSTRTTDSRVEVLVGEQIATINPDVYGHFTEHIGGVIYDGIWVGENSKVPNTNGIRTALVDAMRRIKPSVIRYPGGCFADAYNWRDGVGERTKRPRRTNFWADDPEMQAPLISAQRFDPNWFGTNEFLRFCRLTGAQPYLAANLRSLEAQDFYEWVEYCNSPAGSTTLADQRAAHGAPDPYAVRFWGVGNETWGCGGNLTPEEYSAEFRRYTAAVPRYGVPLKFIAAGANSADYNWTRGFFARTAEKGAGQFNNIYGWGLHHYSWNVSAGRTNDWVQGKGDALNFNTEQYYELLREADRMESLIREHWTIMGEYDRQHRVKLVVDEWGAWHRRGSEADPTHLFGQTSTMRDALLAGLTLDTFNRHADKVAMANVAQLINNLHSLFLAHEDKFVVTPNFHVFEMYAAHQGAQSVRALFSAPSVAYTRRDQPATLWGLNGSASINGKQLTLTVVNPNVSKPRETEVAVRGARVQKCMARVLTASDVHAHNTFANPRGVEEPLETQVSIRQQPLVFRFPPASVTRLQMTLS